MQRFFFHLHDGSAHWDREGQEFESLASARKHAAKYASELLRSNSDPIWLGEQWRLEVADASGLTLSTLFFFGIDAPAAGAAKRF